MHSDSLGFDSVTSFRLIEENFVIKFTLHSLSSIINFYSKLELTNISKLTSQDFP